MKCTKCVSEKMIFNSNNAIDLGDTAVMVFYRCHNCWYTHSFTYQQPYLNGVELDQPRLVAMYGEERYRYFKCSTPESDTFTLVARRKLATKERLEAMGFIVEEVDQPLPGYRLYELV